MSSDWPAPAGHPDSFTGLGKYSDAFARNVAIDRIGANWDNGGVSGDCHACAEEGPTLANGRPTLGRGEGIFTDTRTGLHYCLTHIEALAAWELDGKPAGYCEWADPTEHTRENDEFS